MTKVTFDVDLQQAFRLGHDCPVPPRFNLDVDPAAISPEARELISARLNDDGQVCAIRVEDGTFFGHSRPQNKTASSEPALVVASAPTIDSLVLAIQKEELERERLAETRAIDEIREEELRLSRDSIAIEAAISAGPDALLSRLFDGTWTYERVSGVSPQADQSDQRLQELYADAQAAVDVRNEAEQAIASTQRAEWIMDYGSPRLRRLLTEGMSLDRTYQAERTAWEHRQFMSLVNEKRPGWIEPVAPLEPSVSDAFARDFAILDAARKVAPKAKLGRYMGRVVCWEEFQGRTIIWPRD